MKVLRLMDAEGGGFELEIEPCCECGDVTLSVQSPWDEGEWTSFPVDVEDAAEIIDYLKEHFNL